MNASTQTLGFMNFLANADAVGTALFALLLGMSVLSWTAIAGRLRRAATMRWRNRRFMREIGVAEQGERPSIVAAHLRHAPFARIAEAGLVAATVPESHRHGALQHRVEDEIANLESGQALLASIASSAPYLGLLGTVWGIYHALLGIAASGQSSLDQVAGPIGEALIMTACGLAVAIPAGLAYNAFQRQIRLQSAEIEKFADACLWGTALPGVVPA